jgi:hypothetical protein
MSRFDTTTVPAVVGQPSLEIETYPGLCRNFHPAFTSRTSLSYFPRAFCLQTTSISLHSFYSNSVQMMRNPQLVAKPAVSTRCLMRTPAREAASSFQLVSKTRRKATGSLLITNVPNRSIILLARPADLPYNHSITNESA